MRYIILLLFLMTYSVVTAAQDDETGTPPVEASTADASTKEGSDITPVPFFKPGHFLLNIYLGNFKPDEEPQFANIRNDYAIGAGISAELDRHPHFALDLELFFINRDYDTSIGPPLWGSLSDHTSVETDAVLAGGRAFYPASGPLRVYASAGLGYFRTKMVVYGSLFGFPGSQEDTSSTLSFYYGAGIGYLFGKWGLGLDYRHLDFDGSFGSFNIDDANLGGDAYLLRWQRNF